MEYQDWRTSIEEPEQITNASIGVRSRDTEVRTTLGIAQGFCSILILVGFIVGLIYMIKGKKSKGKRTLIGLIIIIVPIVLNWILGIVRVKMLFNMM